MSPINYPLQIRPEKKPVFIAGRKNFFLYCILFAPLIITVSCRKENQENLLPSPANNSQGVASTYLIQVFNSQMQALPGVSVRLGSSEDITEADGSVLFSAADWPNGNLVLQASKTGYFDKFQSIVSRTGTQTIRIVLQAEVFAGSFSASTGGMVNIPEGGMISFSPNSIVDFSGDPYNGPVNVYSRYLDPASALSSAFLPNTFYGNGQDGSGYFLENHGAVITELRDGMGMPLQLAENSAATLSIPVGDFDQGSPLPSLPLYSFSVSQGIWLEEGLATLNGDYYTGEVGHFSFWMCPFYYDHHFISGSLACAGNALGSAEVSVYNQWGAFLGSVVSDNGGGFSGMAPEGIALNMRVNDPCGTEVFSQDFGPIFTDTYLNSIEVCANGANYSSISGILEDCEGEGVSGSLCFIQSNGILDVLSANAAGEFQGNVLFCSSSESFSAVGFSPLTGESSGSQVFAITPVQSFGALSICESPEQYVQFTMDGTPYYFIPGEFAEFQASYNQELDRIYLGVIGGEFMNETQFGLQINGSAPGNYSVGGNPFAYSFLVQGNDGSVYLNVEIASAGNTLGAVVEGSIEDQQFNDAGGISHWISDCSFRMNINYIIE